MIVWKDFRFKGLNYMVSNTGEVYGVSSKKILKQRIDSDGYSCVTLGRHTCRTVRRVHRLVAENHLENNNEFKEVNHIDGVKTNNNVTNLEWCTRSHNVKHSFDMGLHLSPKGSKNGRAVLDEDKVVEIRTLLNEGCTRYFLAKKYGVSWSCINFIYRNKTWNN